MSESLPPSAPAEAATSQAVQPKAGTKRISMWSGPRNVSTATMYSFRQRSDTIVFDEPLYGYYLNVTGLEHPGYEAVLETMNTDGDRIIEEVLLADGFSPVRFYKNMAHHITGLDLSFLHELDNMLLTRDPREMLPSLDRGMPDPTLRDTGYQEQLTILEFMLSQTADPVVLDARLLLERPEAVLRETCQRLGIAFEPAMLHWPAGPKPEDGVWADHWYASVHASTGFAAYQRKDEVFPAKLEPLLEQCLPIYEKLRSYAITGE